MPDTDDVSPESTTEEQAAEEPELDSGDAVTSETAGVSDAPAGDDIEGGDTESGGTESGGTESGGTESGGTESGGTESGGTESGGTESGGVEGGDIEGGDDLPLLPRLEREGDIAADYLEGLLDIADLDGDIDLDVENDRAMVSIVGGKLDRLIGPAGATLEALQELTRLAVLRETGERSRLMLDIGNTRARRRAELVRVAERAVDRVRTQLAPMKLDPMTPFERKVVHDAVAAAGLRSESEGVEPSRCVVVLPPE